MKPSVKKFHKANSIYYSLKADIKGWPTVMYTALEYTFMNI